MSNTHCDNCDKDALRSELVPFPFMGGTGLRHAVPCETAPSVRALKNALLSESMRSLSSHTERSVFPTDLPEGRDTAIAVAVAPENMEDAIAAVSPDKLLGVLYWVDEYIRRLTAAKKGLIAEAQVAMSHGELPSIDLEVAGHRYQYRQSSSNDYDDVPLLLQELVNLGIKPYTLGRAVGYLRAGELRAAVEKLPDAEREIAFGLLDEHKVKKPGAYGLVDLTRLAEYKKRR